MSRALKSGWDMWRMEEYTSPERNKFMSTEVKLIGVGNITLPDVPTPCGDMSATARGVIAQLGSLGWGMLHRDLNLSAAEAPDVLVAALTGLDDARIERFLLIDPDTFLTHVQENPGYWNDTDFNWPPALAALHQDIEEGHLITWWFIAEY